MPAGNFPVGVPVAVPGAQTLVLPRSGQLLGFFANATTTLVVNDALSVATAGAGNQKASLTACAVGWNPLPLDLLTGLVLTPGAAILAVVA